MLLTPDIKLQNNLRVVSKLFGGAVLFVAIIVLAGWQFNIEFFKRPLPNLVAMNPATAVAFVFSSASFLLFNSWNSTQTKIAIGKFLALLVFLIGGIKFCGIIFDYNARIDSILFADKLMAEVGSTSNRMAPNTAFNFILMGIALLTKNWKISKKHLPSHYISILIALLAMLSVVGYIYQVQAFYGILSYIPMAIHTAVCFLLMSLAILFALPDKGVMKEFTSTFAGSITARRLFPAASVIPVIIGLVSLSGYWTNTFTAEFAMAILVLNIMVVFFGLIWYNSVLLNKRDYHNKQIEEEVEQTNKFLSTILENIPNMIFVKEAEGLRFVRFNKAGEELLGYSRHDLLGKSDYDFFPKEQADFFINKDRSVFLNGELLDIEEEPINTARGQRWLHTKKIPIYDEKGKAIYLIGISEDITERRKHEEAIRQLNKELEAFTYSVSHDLRAPLRSINGFTKMLEEDYKDKLDAEGLRLCHVVQKNAQKMGELIDDLLAFSRLGRQEVHRGSINMEQLATNVIEEIKKDEVLGSFRITINGLLPAKGDYSLMHQVFINLLSNAVKYSHKTEKPEIEIGSEEKNNENVYYVKDNGVGFDMQYYNKLFGVFQRLHKVSEFEGTGVGLAIVHRIITKHGGRVWAEAKVNEGATFYFSLPKNE